MIKVALGCCLASLAVALCVAPARADSITVSGTYSATTAGSAFSAAGTSFTMAFSIPSPVVPAGSSAGFDWTTLQNVTFTLGGGSPQTITGAHIAYESTAGGSSLVINASTGGELYEWTFLPSSGTQLYSGLESAPTLLTGTFPINTSITGCSGSFFSDSVSGCGAGKFSQGTIVDSAGSAMPTPEPTSLYLLGFGLLGTGLLLRRTPMGV